MEDRRFLTLPTRRARVCSPPVSTYLFGERQDSEVVQAMAEPFTNAPSSPHI